MRAAPVLLLLAALLSGAGCSALLVKKVPSYVVYVQEATPNARDFPCTRSRLAPLFDFLVAGGAGGAAAAAGLGQDVGGFDQEVVIIAGASTAAVFGLSSLFGLRHTKRCRQIERSKRDAPPAPAAPPAPVAPAAAPLDAQP
jgi:hypothetical protein